MAQSQPVAGDRQAVGLDRIDAGVRRAGDRGALDAAGDAFQRDGVLAAADDLAVVDRDVAHAPRSISPCASSPSQRLAPSKTMPVSSTRSVLGHQQMAVAAIDDAGCAGDAGEPHAARQGEVGDDVGAGRQEQRRVAVGRDLQHPGKGLALVVERARPDAEIGGVDRAAHRRGLDAVEVRGRRRTRAGAAAASRQRRRRKLRLFSIGTGPRSSVSADAVPEIVPASALAL